MAFLKKCAYSLKKILSLVSYRVGDLGTIVIMAMVLMVIVDIILRRFFNSPLAFSFELVGVMLVVIVYCSVPYTTNIDRHVSIEVLTSRFPPRAQTIITTVTDFLSAVVFGLVGWRSIDQAIHIWDIGNVTGILKIPYYPFIFIVALGSILASLTLLVGVIHSMIGEVKK